MPIRSAISSAMLSVCVDISTAQPALECAASKSLTTRHVARVQAHHRLVDHQHFRVVQERRGEDQPLPHAVRIAFGQIVQKTAQVEALGLAGDPLADGGPIQPVHLGDEFEEFAAGEFFVKEGFLGHVTDIAGGLTRLAPAIAAADADPAFVRAQTGPPSTRMAVVFPAPLGPSSAKSSPPPRAASSR